MQYRGAAAECCTYNMAAADSQTQNAGKMAGECSGRTDRAGKGVQCTTVVRAVGQGADKQHGTQQAAKKVGPAQNASLVGLGRAALRPALWSATGAASGQTCAANTEDLHAGGGILQRLSGHLQPSFQHADAERQRIRGLARLVELAAKRRGGGGVGCAAAQGRLGLAVLPAPPQLLGPAHPEVGCPRRHVVPVWGVGRGQSNAANGRSQGSGTLRSQLAAQAHLAASAGPGSPTSPHLLCIWSSLVKITNLSPPALQLLASAACLLNSRPQRRQAPL